MANYFFLITISLLLYVLAKQSDSNSVDQTLLFTRYESSLDVISSQDLPNQTLLPSRMENYYGIWKVALHDFKLLRDRIWPNLDQIVGTTLQSESTASTPLLQRVSGGIFLNHRLTKILLALTNALLQEESLRASMVKVCETGFGAGHGIALYWAAATRAVKRSGILEVVSFDFYSRVYQPRTLNWLKMSLYNTSDKNLLSVKGNTCKTVPDFFTSQSACGIVHGSSSCPSDNIDIVLFAAGCGTILTSTAMNSFESGFVYFTNYTAVDPLTFHPNKIGQWL